MTQDADKIPPSKMPGQVLTDDGGRPLTDDGGRPIVEGVPVEGTPGAPLVPGVNAPAEQPAATTEPESTPGGPAHKATPATPATPPADKP